ncbi:MAG: hypothetical protein K0S39_6044, partial [Paenibacillus sp.]|nr:hypothetical protein [Paenibacillus sp.]
MYIKWIPELQPYQILLPKQVIHKYGSIPPSLTLHFGAWKTEVNVELREELPEDIMVLSSYLITHFKMPDTLPYEMYVDGTHLHIGPVIAFLVSNKDLTPCSLNEYRGYFRNYETIKGLIYMCSVDGINPGNKTIEGYCYNPQADGDIAPWVKGIFPYPGVVYRRIGINKNRLYDDLMVQTDRKIFNPYFLNKWELWESLHSNPLRDHLPHTQLLDNPQTLKEMLALYGSVYLKPAIGSMGQGIVKLEKTPTGFLFINRSKAKTFITNESKAWDFLRQMRKNRKYLIQQSVAMTYQNKNVDFRVIMQKDGSEQWTCSGTIARYSKDGRFYTNDVSSISLGKDALQAVFQLNDEEAGRKEEEIIS